MQVWLWQEKQWRSHDAKRWLVEWWTVTPKALARVTANEARGEYDEYDPDCDIEGNEREFGPRAKGAAVAFAKRMAASELSAYGCARVSQQVVSTDEVPVGNGEWVTVGEPFDV